MTHFRARAFAAVRAALGLESEALTAFRQGMAMDYEKWHDGGGHDLDALRRVPESEHATLVALLDPPSDWRDVEALAALRTPAADDALSRAARSCASNEVRVTVLGAAPHVVDDDTRIAVLHDALATATLTDGLMNALRQVAIFHPPPVIASLLHAIRSREAMLAYHFAETFVQAHGIDTTDMDDAMRQLLLRFSTPDGEARERALSDVCRHCGIPLDAIA